MGLFEKPKINLDIKPKKERIMRLTVYLRDGKEIRIDGKYGKMLTPLATFKKAMASGHPVEIQLDKDHLFAVDTSQIAAYTVVVIERNWEINKDFIL